MYENIQIFNGDPQRFEEQETVVRSLLTNQDFMVVDEHPDALAVIGGDGSYLEAMRALNYPETPTFGVHAGNLGYFQEVSLNGLSEFLRLIKQDQVRTDLRNMLEVTTGITGHSQVKAINDVVVSRDSSQAMKAELTIGAGRFARFIGDGLIVATAQGSTAYAAAAGGPIIEQAAPVFSVVPSNAHDTVMYESLRAPLVVSDEQQIAIRALEHERRRVKIEIDGRQVDHEQGEIITIKKSSNQLRVLRPTTFDFIQHLATKLIQRS